MNVNTISTPLLVCERSLTIFGVAKAALICAMVVLSNPAQSLVVNPTFDSSVNNLPNAGVVKAAFASAALFYSNSFSDPVTVNLTVSWGKVASFSLPSGALGASTRNYITYCNGPCFPGYTLVRSQLLSDATTSIDTTAIAVLPNPTSVTANDPQAYQPTTPYLVSVASARAIGLFASSDNSIDGYVGFGGSSTLTYTFNANGTTAPGTFDFGAVALHEIAEVLGRVSGIGTGYYMPLDLFRYSSSGVLDYTVSGPAFLSPNGGQKLERGFNNIAPGDLSDWISGAQADVSDAFTAPGTSPIFSDADRDALDLIGWNPASCGPVKTCASVPTPQFINANIIGDPTVFSLGQAGITAAYATQAIPEPISLELFGVGLAFLALTRRRQFMRHETAHRHAATPA